MTISASDFVALRSSLDYDAVYQSLSARTRDIAVLNATATSRNRAPRAHVVVHVLQQQRASHGEGGLDGRRRPLGSSDLQRRSGEHGSVEIERQYGKPGIIDRVGANGLELFTGAIKKADIAGSPVFLAVESN